MLLIFDVGKTFMTDAGDLSADGCINVKTVAKEELL